MKNTNYLSGLSKFLDGFKLDGIYLQETTNDENDECAMSIVIYAEDPNTGVTTEVRFNIDAGPEEDWPGFTEVCLETFVNGEFLPGTEQG